MPHSVPPRPRLQARARMLACCYGYSAPAGPDFPPADKRVVLVILIRDNAAQETIS